MYYQSTVITFPNRNNKHRQRPELGWVSLCTDGAISPITGIGSAELWGIQIAWENGFERLLIQSNNKEATSNPCALVRSIARLRNLGWTTTTQWISRTENEPADMLVKFDNLPYYTTSYFDQPPKLLLPLLDFDILNSL
ncbi:hypothetical protein V6N12_070614 [Hibiscus sabdariffa]|uniref:RNase H type-1 domain-containing protein n=1 Tax=Hibiscus sabdariffa TaxID=183260 RepID=A0ABR2FHK1_9ROSI